MPALLAQFLLQLQLSLAFLPPRASYPYAMRPQAIGKIHADARCCVTQQPPERTAAINP